MAEKIEEGKCEIESTKYWDENGEELRTLSFFFFSLFLFISNSDQDLKQFLD